MSGIFGAEELSAYVTRTIATTDIDAPGGIVASLNICNRSNTPALITVAVTTELDNFDSASQYIEYESVLQPKEVLERTSITLQAGRYITVMSSVDNVNCTVWGISNGRFVTTVDPFAATEVSFIANDGEANLRMGRATTDLGAATYSLTGGTMPTNLVLQSNGEVTGIAPTTGYVSGGAVSAVTIEATVDGVTTPKSFNITKLWQDGSSPKLAAASAYTINQLDIGNFSDGVYWIKNDRINNGVPFEVYCDMTADNGGWTMLAYAGSTQNVGNVNQMMFDIIGNIGRNRIYGQESFSRFDYAKLLSGASASSQAMWRRTTDTNKILIHSMDEMWTRIPYGSKYSDRNFNGSGAGYPITTMKMSVTGNSGLEVKTNGRYENGPGYPGIAWNSTYNDNTDNVGSFSTYLNRRQIVYWETNGPQDAYTVGQWFHGSPLSLGDGSVASGGTERKDIEIYFREAAPA